MKTARLVRPALAIAAVVMLTALAGCSSSGSSFTGSWGEERAGKPSLTI